MKKNIRTYSYALLVSLCSCVVSITASERLLAEQTPEPYETKTPCISVGRSESLIPAILHTVNSIKLRRVVSRRPSSVTHRVHDIEGPVDLSTINFYPPHPNSHIIVGDHYFLDKRNPSIQKINLRDSSPTVVSFEHTVNFKHVFNTKNFFTKYEYSGCSDYVFPQELSDGTLRVPVWDRTLNDYEASQYIMTLKPIKK